MDNGSVRVHALLVLTLAVLAFCAFAILVASLDVIGEMREAARLDEVTGLLSRHLMADLLGHEEARPPRATELAWEQAGKASAG